MRFAALWASTRGWFLRYDHLQSVAIFLLYLQVLCSLIGSLGVLYNGILLANLVLALFALVAIESGSERLGRIYAVILALALLLDITWFILFTNEIRQSNRYTEFGKFWELPLRIVLWMQSISFGLHFVSSFIWLMMYRIGLRTDYPAMYQPVDFDGRIGNLFIHSSSLSALPADIDEEVLGGSIYDPAYYYSLFPDPDGLYSGSKDKTEKADADGVESALPHILPQSF
ncbi:hypothetical protein O6H91_17G026800 [Diphasiastrum complanatum]|uniref:Uncharacterized protein n=1 Tax=Diphasiastrum complanatum TaxID=34168 RepID=A0ACC2B543_DIPCM|nr:hypothetical protein O6H91_17G026800 [Diphasiastrum complanatum]